MNYPAGNGAVAWLRDLAALLEQSTCRHRGNPVSLEQGLDALVQLWARQGAEGRAVFWVGNGGSAAMVSHISQDLLNKCGLRSLHFNDPALITGMSNDYGYEQVFRRPLQTLAREGDLLMAVSSSGRSPNICAAVTAALEMGMQTATLSAFAADNHLQNLPTALSFHTPTEIYGHAELAHEALLHAAVDVFAQSLTAK